MTCYSLLKGIKQKKNYHVSLSVSSMLIHRIVQYVLHNCDTYIANLRLSLFTHDKCGLAFLGGPLTQYYNHAYSLRMMIALLDKAIFINKLFQQQTRRRYIVWIKLNYHKNLLSHYKKLQIG